MSTTSRIRLFAIAATGALLGGCLPGPWDYVPRSDPAFRGITVSGYAVADRPVEHLCFERLYALGEASAEGFAFYESAAVGIAGNFSGDDLSLALTPDATIPNCFTGPATALFQRGGSYELTATFVWDSAGIRTTTELSAVAQIPLEFEITDTARAPSLAATGVALDGITDPAAFQQLPPGPRALFTERYGDTLVAMQGDSAALAAWLADNGARMRADLTGWLQADQIAYGRGDTLFYLSAQNNFSNLSHFFKARRDDLVKGVLISHLFDTINGFRPVTAFDSLFGIAPDSGDFYYPGGPRRLIFYGDYVNPDGRHIFDSLGFVNAWFWSGRNRIYFYGTERIYSDYQVSREAQAGNTKIRLPTNVTGGQGFFAGMIVDSFEVNIELDSLTQAFPYTKTRAYECRNNGWEDTRDCIGYYGTYCEANAWAPADCRLNAVYRLLDPADSLPPAVRDAASAWAAADPLLALGAAQRYCIDNNYPADVPECAAVRAECENEQQTGNGCQLLLWQRCQLSYWKLPACAEGLRSYCRARRDVHVVACRDVAE